MTMRKCICLGQDGTLNPGSEQDFRWTPPPGSTVPSIAQHFSRTGTKWVRMWADWWSFQPRRPSVKNAFDSNYWQSLDMNKMNALDEQVKLARSQGIAVIVVSTRTAPWLTESELTPYNSSVETPLNRQNNSYRLPLDLGVNSYWGQWIRWLYNRYAPNSPVKYAGADIQVLEPCNEPNYECWPQLDVNKNPIMHLKVRDMLETARSIGAERGHSIYLMGPSLSDSINSDPGKVTPYATFMSRFFSLGFMPNSKFIWSHHNYRDIETGVTAGSSIDAASKLFGNWPGYSEGYGPELFNSEGGARLSQVSNDQDVQAYCVEAEYTHYIDNIGMQSNYLLYDPPLNNYSGLLNAYSTQYRERPVYGAWAGLSTGPTDLNGIRGWEAIGPWGKWEPAACSMRPGHLEVFVVSGDNKVWHVWQYDIGWSQFELFSDVVSQAPAAVSRKDGQMDVFVVSPAGEVWTRYFTSPAGWSGWNNLGGSATSAPAVLSMHENHLELFVRWSDNTIRHKWWYGSGWSDWAVLDGSRTWSTAPSAVSWGNGRMDVFTRGFDAALYHTSFNGSTWSSWGNLGGNFPYTPACCSWASGRLDVFVHGNDDRIWRRFRDRTDDVLDDPGAPAKWSDWEPVTGSPQLDVGAPGAVSWGRGRYDLFAIKGNTVWHGWNY